MIKRYLASLCQKYRTRGLSKCGRSVRIGRKCHIQGTVEVGNNVSIGEGAWIVSTRAKLVIHDKVVLGPNVTIYTGDHPIHVIGKHIIDVTEADKAVLTKETGEQFDKDVVIEEGCWIGTRAIILKGVTIGRGSVIGAGAVVTKDVPPYSVYVGTPPMKVYPRFSQEEISEHEKKLEKQGSV